MCYSFIRRYLMKTIGILVFVLVLLGIGYAGYTYRKGYAPATPGSSYLGPSETAGTTESTTGTEQNSVYASTTNAALGRFMTDLNGMTLYIFTKDSPGVSTCTGQCLVNWPAYLAPESTGQLPANVTVITRSDGKRQYAWKGMPLYYYINDKKPGDTTGEGVGGVWYVAK